MDGREHRIYEEAAALWRELYGEPPPKALDDGCEMLDLITHSLDETPYVRLRSPFLRPSTIAGPAQPKDEAQFG
jgi:hypothetical protein